MQELYPFLLSLDLVCLHDFACIRLLACPYVRLCSREHRASDLPLQLRIALWSPGVELSLSSV
jgi:hypothetical protein